MVYISDIEKTVLDGLKMPGYCGGIAEVAKGFWMKRDKSSSTTLSEWTPGRFTGA